MLNIGVVIGLIKKLAPVASPEVIAQAVNDYLDDHPEIEVADGSITEEKLASDVALTLSTLESDVSDVKTAIDGILDHETYQDGSGTEYDPVAASNTVASARITINIYDVVLVSTPTTTTMTIFPVEQGKTYKVKGYCDGSKNRPLLIVANSVVTSGTVANENEYDSVLGASAATPAVDEQEYTALRTGYLYINSSGSDCGVWLKKTVTQTKYHIDDVMEDVGGLKEDVSQNESDITDILSNETYPGTGSSEYVSVSHDKSADSSRMTINVNDKVLVSTPTTTKLRTYPVVQGKTYKVKGYCDGSKNRPLLVVADVSVLYCLYKFSTSNFNSFLFSTNGAIILNKIYIPITILTYFFVLLLGSIISSIDTTINAKHKFFTHELKKLIIYITSI